MVVSYKGRGEEIMECYEILYLIITALGVLATFIIGTQANRISKAIDKHNIEMEIIEKRPLPIIDAVYVSKSLNTENYDYHMRFYYGNMNEQELSLNNQAYVRALDSQNPDDEVLINECFEKKKKYILLIFIKIFA